MSGDSGTGPDPAAGPEGVRDEEAQELYRQLREAPAEELLADLFGTMLSTAQVKLGRRDARLFIDLCAQGLDHARPHLSEAFTAQVESALGQLRLAQVTAESEAAKAGASDPQATPAE